MKKLVLKYFILLILPVLFLYSIACTPQGCDEETQATVNGTFYRTGTGTSQAPDSVTLFGLGKDTNLIYDNARDERIIKIPLDAGSDTSRFVMMINDSYDTVTFIYTSYTHLVSKACGFTFYHVLDTIINNRDTINYYIINRDVTTIYKENIRIFY
jgi:hypothetical protein